MLRQSIYSLMSIVLLSALAFGQQQQQQQQAAQKEPEFVNHKEFKTKIIELKNRNPLELVSVLSALGSGFKGAKVSGNTEFKTITVRDFPENIVIIEDALKRLDVPKPPKPPEPPKRDIEITAYILIASNQEAAASQYPAPLRDVVTQLQKTLGFKNYQLLTPIVQRTSAYSGSLSNQGTAVFPGEAFAARYELQISRIGPENWEKPDSNVVFVGLTLSLRGNSNDDFRQIGEAKISTNLNVKENEKMVVGTSSMKDKGLILVVIAKYMN